MDSTSPPTAFAHRDRLGRTYFLHGRYFTRPGGARQLTVYFSRRLNQTLQLPALPPGYRVVESPVTGRPYARKE
jgi:hypothetical protein